MIFLIKQKIKIIFVLGCPKSRVDRKNPPKNCWRFRGKISSRTI